MASKRSEFSYLADQTEGSDAEAETDERVESAESAEPEAEPAEPEAETETDGADDEEAGGADDEETDGANDEETDGADDEETDDEKETDDDEETEQRVYVLQGDMFGRESHRIYDIKHIDEVTRRHSDLKLVVVSVVLNSMDSGRAYKWGPTQIPVKVEGAVTEVHVAYLQKQKNPGQLHVWTRDGVAVIPPWVVGEGREDIAFRNKIIKARLDNINAERKAFRERTVPCAGNYGQVDSKAQFSVRFPTENAEDFEFGTVSSETLSQMASCKWYKSGYPENYHGNEDIREWDYFSEWPDSFVAYIRKDPIMGREEEDGLDILDGEYRAFLFGEARPDPGLAGYTFE